jgi:hypothetical protein
MNDFWQFHLRDNKLYRKSTTQNWRFWIGKNYSLLGLLTSEMPNWYCFEKNYKQGSK